MAYLQEDQRLVILRILNDLGFKSNSSILHSLLNEKYGHNMSRDQVRTELQWLEEQGLIVLELVDPTLFLVKLTSRGEDVANGRARNPGVKRPSPRD